MRAACSPSFSPKRSFMDVLIEPMVTRSHIFATAPSMAVLTIGALIVSNAIGMASTVAHLTATPMSTSCGALAVFITTDPVGFSPSATGSMSRRLVHDDQHIWLVDLGFDRDALIVHSGEGPHRRPPALCPEVWERLGMVPFQHCRLGERLGGHDRPLPSPAMESDLEHDLPAR